jgi:Sugar phosphate permease
MEDFNPLRDLDEKKLGLFHIKTTLLAGAGTFVDGYDLTAGALVFSLLEKSLGTNVTSLSETLFLSIITGNIVGAILFGQLVKHGRKKFYGIDALMMTLGSLLQGLFPNVLALSVLRFVLGVGIGADYVLSPLINAEYSNRKDRGKLMAISGGLMWNVGALASTLVALSVSSLPGDLVWRIVLSSGAIPALLVIWSRRKFPETPRYLLFLKRDTAALEREYGVKVSLPQLLRTRMTSGILLTLFLASLTWYLFDVSAYASVFFGPNLIAQKLGMNGIIFELLVLSLFAIPGNVVSTALNDRVGRRLLQSVGFLGMGLMTLIFATQLSSANYLLALGLYGLSSLFSQVGPGTVVGFWGVELFPTELRGLTQGVTVMAGRLGVITTTFVFPTVVSAYGVFTAMVVLGTLSLLASLVTLKLREPKGVSLDQTEREVLTTEGTGTSDT